jgi:hypothetical protein
MAARISTILEEEVGLRFTTEKITTEAKMDQIERPSQN